MTRAPGAERIAVGFYGSAASALLPDVLRAFTEQHPAVEVTLREFLLDRIDDILGGEVDVAFTRLQPVVDALIRTAGGPATSGSRHKAEVD